MPLLLFVCHANITRSPAAEALARQGLASRAAWQVASAGVRAIPGAPADEDVVQLLASAGIDASQHRARQLDHALLAAADLTLTFESSHREWIVHEAPAAARRTLTIRRAAALAQRIPRRVDPISYLAADDHAYRRDDDFADPHGKGRAIVEHAVAEIEQLLAILLPAIDAVPRRGHAPEPSRARRRGVVA